MSNGILYIHLSAYSYDTLRVYLRAHRRCTSISRASSRLRLVKPRNDDHQRLTSSTARSRLTAPEASPPQLSVVLLQPHFKQPCPKSRQVAQSSLQKGMKISNSCVPPFLYPLFIVKSRNSTWHRLLPHTDPRRLRKEDA